MRDLLLRAIQEQTTVDIFFTVEINGQNNCILFYSTFLVIGIDDAKNTFIGYAPQERTKPIKDRVVTEDSISAICRVRFEED